ncbi:MAG: bifunctional 4-hydroxy-2-oxoglutarate aldolase/2-dehydro-3-deoxy-phosphogluconate aldolase [Chloroflexota bacterium]
MSDVLTILQRGGLVPIIRLPDLTHIVPLVTALLKGGATAVELTMTSPGAADALTQVRQMVPAFDAGRAVIGMGSVLDVGMAQTAVSAGAQFIVAPHTDLPTVAYCRGQNIPVMPGVLTPTEAQTAWAAGASVVKLFPARAVGPAYLKDLLAPLPHLRIMPTGGINLDNIPAYIQNGAVAVGVGGNLVSAARVQKQAWAELAAETAVYRQTIQEARNNV